MKIQESAENYLEAILMLSKQKLHVRSIDIATELEFSKPSVSVAMKNLRENGYILMDNSGHITLTDAGRKIAETTRWAWCRVPDSRSCRCMMVGICRLMRPM